MVFFIIIVIIIVAWIFISTQVKKKRREMLFRKYNDAAIVDKITRHMFWQGQTQEQLIDSLGRPLDIDERVFKTKTKETWKYNRIGKNRFGLRITIENGVVVGWDQK